MLEADTAWFHWSSAKDLNVRLPVEGANTIEPLELRDGWSFATGANYKLADRWQLRGGFWYEPRALPDPEFSPAFMDLSRYGLSAGVGYSLTTNLAVDAAYSAVFFHNRTINNEVTPGGTYSDFANVLALNFTYRFGANK
jgi:long-chain fatty acid transport protein